MKGASNCINTHNHYEDTCSWIVAHFLTKSIRPSSLFLNILKEHSWKTRRDLWCPPIATTTIILGRRTLTVRPATIVIHLIWRRRTKPRWSKEWRISRNHHRHRPRLRWHHTEWRQERSTTGTTEKRRRRRSVILSATMMTSASGLLLLLLVPGLDFDAVMVACSRSVARGCFGGTAAVGAFVGFAEAAEFPVVVVCGCGEICVLPSSCPMAPSSTAVIVVVDVVVLAVVVIFVAAVSIDGGASPYGDNFLSALASSSSSIRLACMSCAEIHSQSAATGEPG